MTPEVIENLSLRELLKLKYVDGANVERSDPGNRGDDDASDRRPAQDPRGTDRQAAPRRRTAAGRHQAGQGLRRHEAQAVGRRQDGRPPRQQGRDRPHSSRRRYAVSARWNAGRDRAESARRAVANERRTDSGNPPGLGGAGAWDVLRNAGVRRRAGKRNQGHAEEGQPAARPARRGCTTE